MNNHRTRGRVLGLVAMMALALFLVPVFEPSRQVSRSPVADEYCDIAKRNIVCSKGLSDVDQGNVEQVLSILDQWAARVKSETEHHFYRFRNNPAEYENSEGYFRMLMLAVVLHEDFGVRYNPAKIGVPGEASASDGFRKGSVLTIDTASQF